MAELKYKIRGNGALSGKPRVYFCCHPEDFNKYFRILSNEILAKQNCAIWYNDGAVERDEDFFLDLKQMQLFVMPITTNLLCRENEALDIDFKFAVENHIPVLPLMQERGLEELFNTKCGDLQFLDKNNTDNTAIGYDEKLERYLSAVLIGDDMAERIRAAFDAYVFLSYRKKDRKYAQELMRLIHKNEFCRDIAIWYDEFLTPGENFNDSIKEALTKSDLFVLTVTPNLVNETNYIMTTEYPMAIKEGKPILPAELVPTDKALLSQKYEGIPECADAYDDTRISDALLESIKKLAIKENDNSPLHNFFIGLAYLGGIDVEVDNQRAVSLITSAAEGGCEQAMQKLLDMYMNGNGVKRDYNEAIKWKMHLNQIIRDEVLEDLKEVERREKELQPPSGRKATMEELMVGYERHKAFKFFCSFVSKKVYEWYSAQSELSEMYHQAGNSEKRKEVLLKTVEHSLGVPAFHSYNIIPQDIVTDEEIETTFFNLHLKLVDCLISERKYGLAEEWVLKTTERFRLNADTFVGKHAKDIKLLKLNLELKTGQILYAQERYEEANYFMIGLDKEILSFIDECLSGDDHVFLDDYSTSIKANNVLYLNMVMSDLCALATEHAMLFGMIQIKLGLMEEAIKSFRDAIANNKKSDRKIDKKKEIICYLQLAELYALLNEYDEMQQIIKKAERLLEYTQENTVETLVLRREFFKKCGEIARLRHSAQAAEYFEEAIKIAEGLISDVPTAENAVCLAELYGIMCDLCGEEIAVKQRISLMYGLADLKLFEDETAEKREALGGIYYQICKYDNNANTTQKAYDIFAKLAFEYPECKSFSARCEELKRLSTV